MEELCLSVKIIKGRAIGKLTCAMIIESLFAILFRSSDSDYEPIWGRISWAQDRSAPRSAWSSGAKSNPQVRQAEINRNGAYPITRLVLVLLEFHVQMDSGHAMPLDSPLALRSCSQTRERGWRRPGKTRANAMARVGAAFFTSARHVKGICVVHIGSHAQEERALMT